MFIGLSPAPLRSNISRLTLASAVAICLPFAGLNASAPTDTPLAEVTLAEPEELGASAAALPAAISSAVIASGTASYYASRFEGRSTASGERYRGGALTAAHRSLPFGSRVRVTNRANGRSVTVRINDRGPFSEGRVIDVSQAAARALGLMASGHALVDLDLIES